MRFAFYHEGLKSAPLIVVDGVADHGFHLSHWVGNRTPKELKADTSTEIAFNFLESSWRWRLERETEIVTNTHYDADGVLACFVLLHPEAARAHRSLLINAATTGDFRRFTTDQALQLELIVMAYHNPDTSPLRKKALALAGEEREDFYFRSILKLLPEILNDADGNQKLWKKEFSQIKKDLEDVQQGKIQMEAYPKSCLTVFKADHPVNNVALFTAAGQGHVLLIYPDAGGHCYDLQYDPYLSFFDTPRRDLRLCPDLRGLQEELRQKERSNLGDWKLAVEDGWAELSFVDPRGRLKASSLQPDLVTARLADCLSR